jgi:hypothetical protein
LRAFIRCSVIAFFSPLIREPKNNTPLIVRDYIPADLSALRLIHARQGFDYKFPDLADPIFVSKLVMQDEHGDILMASLARLTCEAYFLLDPDAGSPRERYSRLVALQERAAKDLERKGLDDAHAWLPPSIAKRFGRRIEQLGWIRDDKWTPYCLRFCGR